ncbi:EAL domain-containing protein [Aquaspirillum sp. LM1]|uniref:EAL domain-containing protein n=1 Tax=Aquaspirillum sp. LM1 TaxID=1938604 RepID=UPI0009851601|nr:EAL domain-containing protein [Aquaspirillum sp. LM1]
MNLNLFQLSSLKTRITLFTLLIFVASIWSLALYISRGLHDDMQRQLGEQQLATASLIADDINQQLTDRLDALAAIADELPAEYLTRPGLLQARLEQRPLLHILFNGGVFATDVHGTAIADVPLSVGRIGTNYLDRDSVAIPLREGRAMIGRPALGKKLRAPIFSLVAPIRNGQGQVIGVLVGTINLGLPNFLEKVTKRHYHMASSYLLVAPQHKLFVTATDKNLIMQPLPAVGVAPMLDRYIRGYEGYGIAANGQGVEELSAAKGIPVAGWFVVAALPMAQAFAPIRDMQETILWASAVLTLLAGGLTWLMLRHQLAPMTRAVTTLAALAHSQRTPPPLPIDRRDEIGQLLMGFNHLLDSLRQREQALQESERRFRHMADQAPALIWMSDTENAGTWYSKRWLDYTGRTMSQELGFGWVDNIYPEDLQRCASHCQAAFDARETFDMEFRLRRADGSYGWVVDIGTPRFDEGGTFLGYIGYCWDISARKDIEARLMEREAYLRAIIENEPECIKILDTEGRLTQMNPAGLTMIEADSFTQVAGRPMLEWIAPEYRTAFAEMHQRVLAGETLRMKFEVIGLKGGRCWQETHAAPMQDRDQVVLLAVSRDISAQVRAEAQLHLAASVFTHAREGITITDADGVIIDVNDTFCRITGYHRDEVLGRNPRMLASGRQSQAFYVGMWRALLDKGHWYGEVWNRRKDGEVYAELITISAVRDALGQTRNYVALFSDITEIKDHQRQLEHIAHYDALTKLPNRVLLADRMHQAMVQTRRHDGQRLAVAYLDLDGFKAVNDRHGHDAGDQLLMAVAGHMREALREGDTLARLGGDEFVVMLLDLADVAASVSVLTRLLAAAAEPVRIGELVLQVSASVGVTFFPQPEDIDADQLLRQADQAMYQAKLAGKNRYHIFDAEQDRSVRGHHESLERIERALAEGEFVLYYQPKVNMRTGAVIGAEALIRWQHPEDGLLSPALFLPMIEEHRLAVDIGEWVIDTALGQMASWQAIGLAIPVSVNVGARQLQHPDFVPRLRALLAAHPEVSPSDLELEVLETSALEDLNRVSKVIEACRDIGVNFALDDFGTGYSSLTYLKRLPVAQLKIDQSFVRDMLDDPDDLAILDGVIGLAGAFRRQVIAEGVETVAHGAILLQLGCELAQGFGIARPMPASELPGWARAWRTDPTWGRLSAIDSHDLPLLFASAEHRAWVQAIAAYLHGDSLSLPPLDPRLCRFGQWLDGDGLVHHAGQPAFEQLQLLHHQLHAVSAELCQLKATGHGTEALARLPELQQLRDALLTQLQRLLP